MPSRLSHAVALETVGTSVVLDRRAARLLAVWRRVPARRLFSCCLYCDCLKSQLAVVVCSVRRLYVVVGCGVFGAVVACESDSLEGGIDPVCGM